MHHILKYTFSCYIRKCINVALVSTNICCTHCNPEMNEEDNNIIYNINNDKYFVICIRDDKTTIVKDGLINIGIVKKRDQSNIVSSDSEENAMQLK